MTDELEEITTEGIKASILGVFTKHFKIPYARNADKIELLPAYEDEKNIVSTVDISQLDVPLSGSTILHTDADVGKFSNLFRPKKFQKTSLYRVLDSIVNGDDPLPFELILFKEAGTIMCVYPCNGYEGIGGVYVRIKDTSLSTIAEDGLAIEPLRNYLLNVYALPESD